MPNVPNVPHNETCADILAFPTRPEAPQIARRVVSGEPLSSGESAYVLLLIAREVALGNEWPADPLVPDEATMRVVGHWIDA